MTKTGHTRDREVSQGHAGETWVLASVIPPPANWVVGWFGWAPEVAGELVTGGGRVELPPLENREVVELIALLPKSQRT